MIVTGRPRRGSGRAEGNADWIAPAGDTVLRLGCAKAGRDRGEGTLDGKGEADPTTRAAISRYRRTQTVYEFHHRHDPGTVDFNAGIRARDTAARLIAHAFPRMLRSPRSGSGGWLRPAYSRGGGTASGVRPPALLRRCSPSVPLRRASPFRCRRHPGLGLRETCGRVFTDTNVGTGSRSRRRRTGARPEARGRAPSAP